MKFATSRTEFLARRLSRMPSRILYFRGGILEAVEDFAPEDLLEAARAASSNHPHLTAEVWRRGRKAAVIRPCWETRHGDMPPKAPMLRESFC